MNKHYTRRPIRLGNSRAVTLPSGWLKLNNIGSSERLMIVAAGDLLILRPLREEFEGYTPPKGEQGADLFVRLEDASFREGGARLNCEQSAGRSALGDEQLSTKSI